MADPKLDTVRAIAAAKEIIDGRDPVEDFTSILVTLEQVVAAILLAGMGDPRKASAMLNEGLVHGVEERLALYQSKTE